MRMRCCVLPMSTISLVFFFFNDTATTEIYTLSLHDALPIWRGCVRLAPAREGLSVVGGGHPHRVQPVRGRAHADRAARERGVPRTGGVASPEGGGHRAQVVLPDSGRSRRRGDGQGADPGRRPGPRLRHQRELWLQRRAVHRLRLSPGSLRRRGDECRRRVFRRATEDVRASRAPLRSREREAEAVTLNYAMEGGEKMTTMDDL